MPILEISSAQAPKDLAAFSKRINALFAELIGKPQSVCMTCVKRVVVFVKLVVI